MLAEKIHILLVTFLLPAISLGQFLGGDGDGSISCDTLFPVNTQDIYCSGGNADGFSKSAILTPINEQALYCSGSEGDGVDSDSSGLLIQFDQGYYCSGGNQDGYSMDHSFSTINDQALYCSGSFRDGYDMDYEIQSLNDQDIYCEGSLSDGYSVGVHDGFLFGEPVFVYGGNADGSVLSDYFGGIYGPSIFCMGGNSDGYNLAEATSLYLGIGLWTGLTSTDWNTGTNWQHEIIPGLDDNVTIPSGCPYYPEIASTLTVDTTAYGSYQCNGLEIQPSASFSTAAPVHVNGKLTVGGTYTATMNGNNANRIYGKGELTVLSGGTAVFGNQTSASGITDLLVYNGGVLNVDGGTLHIDDQLHVYSGGTLNMTDGELWVHKFGYGTSLSSFNPANFYVEAGAQGGISGGLVRICGRYSPYGYNALTLFEPGFSISGTATFRFEHGTYGVHYDCGIDVSEGVSIPKVVIDKPGNTVTLTSDLQVPWMIDVQPGSSFIIENGNTLTVGP